MRSWLPPHSTSVQETSIPTSPVRAANQCRNRTKRGSARFRKLRNSIQNRLLLERSIREERRKTVNPASRPHQLRNVRCTRNGSNYPPSRAASEPANSHQESSNGGRI